MIEKVANQGSGSTGVASAPCAAPGERAGAGSPADPDAAGNGVRSKETPSTWKLFRAVPVGTRKGKGQEYSWSSATSTKEAAVWYVVPAWSVRVGRGRGVAA